MENVLQDMVQRLRAIELLLRTQNELLTRVLAEPEQDERHAEASGVRRAAAEPTYRTNMPGKLRALIREAPIGACPQAKLKSGREMPHHAKWVRTPGVVNSLSVPRR